MKPRIALVVPNLTGGGGVPAVARFLLDTIAKSGKYDLELVSLAVSSRDMQSVRLFSPISWFRGVSTKAGIWRGVPFTHVGAFASELEFQRYKRRSVLTEILEDCKLIQVVCGSPAWGNAVIGLGKPVAMQVATRAVVERRMRDCTAKNVLGFWRKLMTFITDKADDRALQSADAIQVENSWMLDYALQLNQDRKVDLRYAPPGVDGDLFRPLQRRNPNEAPYVLCVGRLSDPRKNIDLLLEAFAQLPKYACNDVRLVLAGSSGPPESFWQRVGELQLSDRVSYVERPGRLELVSLYQEATVFALSSDEEGLGIVLLEAMACGVPVVSTRCGGPDGIITDGKDGYLVPLDDASIMSLRIAQLLDDSVLNLAMGAEARQTIDNRYDESVAGQAFVEMWDRMLDTTNMS